jgi:hypothetical protein
MMNLRRCVAVAPVGCTVSTIFAFRYPTLIGLNPGTDAVEPESTKNGHPFTAIFWLYEPITRQL